jgi:hypothetical protein
MYKSDPRQMVKELSITLFAAISILPFITRSFTLIKNEIENLSPALDIYYYQRVFSLNRDYFQLGNMYVDNVSLQQRQINILSIGEVFQKYVFHLLDNRIILTYFLFSLVMIFLWIFLIQRLIAYDYPQSFFKNILFTCALLVIFFGNTNLVNANYPFARIISPQISVFLWLIGLILLKRIVITKKPKTLEFKYLIQFSLLLFVASFTYLYTFVSLFGTSIVIFSFLVIQKRYPNSLWFLTFTLISILPFMVLNFNKSKEERFQDAGARMGLIKYHFPGSLTTILISLGIIFAIVMHKHFINKKFSYSNLERVLVISSIGLIVASQSNIVTGREIQFYHFSLFAKMNLMVYLVLITSRITFRKFQNEIVRYRVIIIVFLPIILILNSFKGVILPLIYDNHGSSSVELLNNKYSSEEKLIVDVANLQNVFPIYSEAKLLYQSDITTYGFSNIEILNRAYISAGCPTKISKTLQLDLDVYRAVAMYMKGKALEKYLKYFNLDKYFASSYIPILDRALKERRIIQSEIDNYLISASKTECVSLAKTYGIDSVIFDKKSQWYSIAMDKNLPVISFTFQGLSLFEYKL